MKNIMKPAVMLGLAGALALGSMTASQARVRPLAAAGIGLAAGAAIAGAAAANTYPGYYGPQYGSYDGYAYAPGYDSYAYSPSYESSTYSPNDYGGHAWGPQSPAYSRTGHGYDTNYIGPNREYQLEGRDY